MATSPERVEWSEYLRHFHARRPGITEDVLSHSRADSGLTPYQWVVEPIGAQSTVLDLACGSGPNMKQSRGGMWMGLDSSMEELDRARTSGRHPLVRADASALPFRDESFDALVCSMALMLLQPLHRSIDEIARVMRVGAPVVILMPGRRPLRARDQWRYARLVRRLGRWRLSYPNDDQMRGLTSLLAAAGLDVVDDERQRFSFALPTVAETTMFVESLYVPAVSARELQRATALASSWVGTDVGIPLRRVIAHKRSSIPLGHRDATTRAERMSP